MTVRVSKATKQDFDIKQEKYKEIGENENLYTMHTYT